MPGTWMFSLQMFRRITWCLGLFWWPRYFWGLWHGSFAHDLIALRHVAYATCFEQKNGEGQSRVTTGGAWCFGFVPNSGTHTTWKWNHVFMFDMVIRISIIILIIIIIIIIIITGIKFCWRPMILKQRKSWWWWLSVQWSLRIHHHNPTTTVCIRKYLHELDCLKMHAVSVAPLTINNMFLIFFANITSRNHTPTAAHMTTADNASEKTVDANGSGTFRNFTPIDNTCEKTIDAYDSTIYIYKHIDAFMWEPRNGDKWS